MSDIYGSQLAMLQAQSAQYLNAQLSVGLGQAMNNVVFPGALTQSNLGAALSKLTPDSPRAAPEADSVLWLRRRVDEICWKG